jgi:hypothetical protein
VLGRAAPVDVVLDGFDAMYWSFRYLQGARPAKPTASLIDRFHPPSPGVRDRFAWARDVSDRQVAEANRVSARAFALTSRRCSRRDGVLLMPTMPDVAPLASADEAGLEDYRNQATRLLCSAGWPGSRSCRCRWRARRRAARPLAARPCREAIAAWCGSPRRSPRRDEPRRVARRRRRHCRCGRRCRSDQRP